VTQKQASRIKRLTALLGQARKVHEEAAISDDWERLLAREAQLKSELSSLLSPPVTAEEAPGVRIVLQEMLALNQRTVEIVETRKAAAATALRHCTLVRRAAKAYGHTAAV